MLGPDLFSKAYKTTIDDDGRADDLVATTFAEVDAANIREVLVSRRSDS